MFALVAGVTPTSVYLLTLDLRSGIVAASDALRHGHRRRYERLMFCVAVRGLRLGLRDHYLLAMQNLGERAVSGSLRFAAKRFLANADLPQGRDPLACFFCYTPEAELGMSPFRLCSACARSAREVLQAPHVRRSRAGSSAVCDMCGASGTTLPLIGGRGGNLCVVCVEAIADRDM